MTDETPKTGSEKPLSEHSESGTQKPEKTIGQTAMAHGKKAADVMDKAANVAEKTSGIFSAIKWVAIAIVMLVIFSGGYAIYKAVSVPAKAVGNAMENVTDAVKSGSDKVIENSGDVINRLIIAASDQARLNELSEFAFESLSTMTASPPNGVKDRVYRASNFAGHEDRVCDITITIAGAQVPVTLANDNKAYATAKALGSQNERLIRLIITAGEKNLGLRSEWDSEAQNWILKWKATTVKKPVEDPVAEQTVFQSLETAATSCR